MNSVPISSPPADAAPSQVSAPQASAPQASAPQASLGRRVRTGVSWTATSTLLTQILALARSIVLARLLAKDDFGLFGMATTVLAALSVLTNMGLDASVIVNKFESEDEMHRQLNTVWTAELGRKVLLSGLLLLAVYPTAKFYGDDRLLSILPIVSLTPLISGFNNIGLVLLRREVNFQRVFWFEQGYAVITTVVLIALGLWTRSVWALVWGQVITVALNVGLSYVLHPYRPRLSWNPDAFRRAFSFGKYMFVMSVMTYVTTTADNVFVGKLLGTEVLGAYVVAYTIANLPGNMIGSTLGSVLMPAFAELDRDGGQKLAQATVRVFLVASTLLALITVPAVLLSHEVVHLLYGAKWESAAPVLRVLMLVGFFRGLLQVVSPLMIGMNRPDLEARSKVVEAIIFVAILGPCVARFGAIGAAWAGVLIYFLSFLMRFNSARRLLPQAFHHVLGIIVLAIGAGCLGAEAGWLALSVTHLLWLRVLVGGLVSVGVTLGCLLAVQPTLRVELGKSLAPIHARLRRRPQPGGA